MASSTPINDAISEELLGFVPPTLGQRLGVEFLGTFWLVLGGCYCWPYLPLPHGG